MFLFVFKNVEFCIAWNVLFHVCLKILFPETAPTQLHNATNPSIISATMSSIVNAAHPSIISATHLFVVCELRQWPGLLVGTPLLAEVSRGHAVLGEAVGPLGGSRMLRVVDGWGLGLQVPDHSPKQTNIFIKGRYL